MPRAFSRGGSLLTGLRIGGELHTKNMYRREWRGGGCDQHDDPLEVPDDRQRLIVALVQKKVAEVLQDERFGASFQMGMLASFESFFRTASRARRSLENVRRLLLLSLTFVHKV